MRALVACEFSGRVRDALIAKGVDAVSCDLLPSETDGPHIQDDVRNIALAGYDLLIAHPPCTYLANSGVRWLHEQEGRWDKMREAADFFMYLLNAPVPRIAIENPVMHRHAGIRRPDFTVQPYQFGDPLRKRTCWWTKNLPRLLPTSSMTKDEAEQYVWKLPPSEDRWKLRSVTPPGMAAAIADQWGGSN